MQFLCKIDQLESVFFTKTRLVAYYERNYCTVEPAKKVLYIKEPKLQAYPINLNDGYSSYIRRQYSPLNTNKALDCGLKYCMPEEFKKSIKNVKKIKILTRGGCLAELMHSYYSKKYTNYQVFVSRYNGDLYMVRHKSSYPVFKPVLTHHEQFMKNVLTESLKDEPNVNKPSDANKTLIGVYHSSFGEFEVIHSEYMFGIQAEKEFNNFDDLEALNTCRWVITKTMWNTLKNNPMHNLKFWLIAYLTNVKDLYIAYKNSKGIIDEPIVHKHLSDIPMEFLSRYETVYKIFINYGVLSLQEAHWNPNICLGFLYKFLQEVNTVMSTDNVNSFNTIYEFNFDAKTRSVTYKIIEVEPEKVLFTPEFINYCKKENLN